MILKSWGNNIKVNSKIYYNEPKQIKLKKNVIPRGNGLSYGDSALYKNVYLHKKNDDVPIYFDKKKKIVTVSATTTVDQLNNYLIERGYFLFVNPGAKNVTVGGAISSDVHGKNHEKHGSFGNYVKEITIKIASGKILKCNNSNKKNLFKAIIGGMGLIGIIINAKIYVRKIKNTFIDQKCYVFDYNGDEFKKHFQTKDEYKICWLNLNSKKIKAVMLLGNHNQQINNLLRLSNNFFIKKKILGFMNINFINFFYPIFKSFKFKSCINFKNFFFELDNIEWKKKFKKEELLQCQICINEKKIFELLDFIRRLILKKKSYVYLCTIKKFGSSSIGLLSFPKRGYTIALDFENNLKNKKIINEIYEFTLFQKGNIYLSKDSLITKNQFEKTNLKISLFKTLKKKYDKNSSFKSFQSLRLGL